MQQVSNNFITYCLFFSRSIKTFFDFERTFCQKDIQKLLNDSSKLEDEIAQLEIKHEKCMKLIEINRGIPGN